MAIIQNTVPRRDSNGKVLDCHDGCLQFFEGRYYLYGTRYGATHGYTPKNRYVCYSSADLMAWTNHGELIPPLPDGIYYRPYVRRQPGSGKFVLWFNAYDSWKGTTDWAAGDGPTPGFYGVAVADRPEGPFEVVHRKANIPEGVGDFNLFVDDDGAGYIIFTRIKRDLKMVYFQMTVEALADDFLSVTGKRSEIISDNVEAPALFKQDGFYYAVMGHCCCFCPGGADAQVYRSRNVLGPYELRGNINPKDASGKYAICAQTSDIAEIRTERGIEHIWIGDRWESAADGIKGHDLQFWSAPLRFVEGDIEPLQFTDQFEIELESGLTRGL